MNNQKGTIKAIKKCNNTMRMLYKIMIIKLPQMIKKMINLVKNQIRK